MSECDQGRSVLLRRDQQIDRATFNPYLSLLTALGSYGISGVDPDHSIYLIGNLDNRHTYFVIIDGKRTDIYSGVSADNKDFDPFNVVFDGSRLWFSNVDAK